MKILFASWETKRKENPDPHALLRNMYFLYMRFIQLNVQLFFVIFFSCSFLEFVHHHFLEMIAIIFLGIKNFPENLLIGFSK